MHHIYRLILGGSLWRAPIKDEGANGPAQILDLGTGTGIWAMEVADELPESLIEGIVCVTSLPHSVALTCYDRI
jgi:methylase of polypeptide subunit release factors